MIADIDMEYDLGSGDQHPPPEVHNLYRFSTVVGGEPSHPTEGTCSDPRHSGFQIPNTRDHAEDILIMFCRKPKVSEAPTRRLR
jgi:hypothetical protein